MSTVGIIVNPHAGKDIRRLVSAAGHTSDATKISIVRRIAAGAIDQGAERVLISADTQRLAERAIDGLAGPIEIIDSLFTGSHLDTVAAAATMWKRGAQAVVALGGDGTCRDVATGWPQVPLIAISTGTNNVFPVSVDATAAGVAAALVALGHVDLDEVSHSAKRVVIDVDDPDVTSGRAAVVQETALVEVALVAASFVGARAITDPTSVRWVVACIAEPWSTGAASIAGRVLPVSRIESGGVVIRLGDRAGVGHRHVRVPLAPGSFATLTIESAEALPVSTGIDLPGGGVLAFDGERTLPVSSRARITASISSSGPRVIDVARTTSIAARDRRFDRTPHALAEIGDAPRKDPHGR